MNAILEQIQPQRAAPPWPDPIGAPARIGIAGRFLSAVEAITEADPNAILVQFLAAAGNLLGGGPHLLIGERRHTLRVWPLVVGSTSTGKKGTGSGLVFGLLESVDPTWGDRVRAGIASGEAIVHHVRDAVELVRKTKKSDGSEIEARDTIEGVTDKRLLLLEEEFARVLRIARKEGTTLSATLREAWDRSTLMTTAKTAPEKATGAHVTVIGHITPEELHRELSSTEISNGFANRFLFVLSRRSQHLSVPPAIAAEARSDLVHELSAVKRYWDDASALVGAEIELARETLAPWDAAKRQVESEAEQAEDFGLTLGKVITRGAPYLLRLAGTYAALDRSLEITPAHLAAAKEVWRYSVASARSVFGDEASHPDAQRILEAIGATPDKRLTRTQIQELFHRHRSASELTRLRDRLIAMGRIEAFVERSEDSGTTGRPIEWWRGKVNVDLGDMHRERA